MPTVTRFPSGDTAVTGTWTNPTNVQADDGSVASVAPGKNTTSTRRQGNFGFDGQIPTGATINSVAIEVEWRVSVNTSIATLRCYVRVGSTNGSNNDNAAEPTTLTVGQFTGLTRPGGGSWTRADLLDGTFFTEIAGVQGNSSTAVTFEFDYIKVTVDYTDPVNYWTPRQRAKPHVRM